MLVYTSCVNNYLPKARVLASSLKKFHPDWTFCLLLGEDPLPGFDLEQEPFDRLLKLEELGAPGYKSWQFRHRLVELCTAIKGAALQHFLSTEKQKKVIYLDPDILVLDSLEQLDEMLDRHDILLTPHQLAPQSSHRAIKDNEICSLRHGIFNLGFLACANTRQGMEFARFWRDRLLDYCIDDIDNGLFTDQKWCDLAPAYFPGLGIIRDPGCNAASWNLTDRRITQDQTGKFFANNSPLKFYHFTGYDSGVGKIMSKIYGKNMPAVDTLWKLYKEKLEAAQNEEPLPWGGNFYSNGIKISDEARCHYRENPAIQALYPDPYLTDPDGRTGFYGYWQGLRARESNRLYVWARKPFRLAWLVNVYLKRHGGIKGVPDLCRMIYGTLSKSGFKGLLNKVRKFKQSVALDQTARSLSALLDHASSPQWSDFLTKAFSSARGVLIFDHMYGGGANDYRQRRIDKYLANNRPCLLVQWDYFDRYLRLTFLLPGGYQILATEDDLGKLSRLDQLKFGHILVNELVLWATNSSNPESHYFQLRQIVEHILNLTKRNRATLEVAIHDFYALCPCYTLLDHRAKPLQFCQLPLPDQKCRDCLAASPYNIPDNFELSHWRANWQSLFNAANIIDFFSEASLALFKKYFKFNPAQIHLTPHEPLTALEPTAAPAPGSPLRIGVIGHITDHKGSHIVSDMSKLLRANEELIVIGALDEPHPANIKVLGDYQRADLPEIMQREKITVCLVPSIWPETFCYVVQEIMQMDMPLVVFSLGAQAERTINYHKGLIAKEITAESALESVRTLHTRYFA